MINWDFLLNILAARDFSFYWISQINNSLSSFKVGILINRVPLIYMSTSLNLGREIPFSLALILLVLCSLMHLTLVLFTSCPLVTKENVQYSLKYEWPYHILACFKLSSWKTKDLSFQGWLTLLNLILSMIYL